MDEYADYRQPFIQDRPSCSRAPGSAARRWATRQPDHRPACAGRPRCAMIWVRLMCTPPSCFGARPRYNSSPCAMPSSVQHPGDPFVLPHLLRGDDMDHEVRSGGSDRPPLRNVSANKPLITCYTCGSARDCNAVGQWPVPRPDLRHLLPAEAGAGHRGRDSRSQHPAHQDSGQRERSGRDWNTGDMTFVRELIAFLSSTRRQ